MKYINNTKDKNYINNKILRNTIINEKFVDAWISESNETIKNNTYKNISYKVSEEGLFATIEKEINQFDESTIINTSFSLYDELFEFLSQNAKYKLVRIWNYVPSITHIINKQSNKDIYQCFNEGRFNAFSKYFSDKKNTWKIPAASAVGVNSNTLKIEFFASNNDIIYLENKDQIPAKNYSENYGELPPIFSRGTIYNYNGQKRLISSGTSSVLGEISKHKGDIYSQLFLSINNLRVLTSQFNLKKYDIHYSFGIEDVALMRVYYKNEKDQTLLNKLLKKILAPNCKISFQKADICRDDLLVEIEAIFIKKGEFDNKSENKYKIIDNKINVESLEIHICEHCNLKCESCCNISPFNKEKNMTEEEFKNICSFSSKYFKSDVFKILGGEPLLNPNINTILDIANNSSISDNIRLVSNGLLLHTMDNEFWNKIDTLTISNYVSAPINTKNIELIWEKAKANEVIVNIKKVNQFNEILIYNKIDDDELVQNIYDDCWIRHRCLLIRNNRFYKCSRAAYFDDFSRKFDIKKSAEDPISYSEIDGISIFDDNFMMKAIEYLNDKKPLESCKYCLGVSGKLNDNKQLDLDYCNKYKNK